MNSYEWHYTKEFLYFVYGNCWQLFEGLPRFLISRVGSKSEIKNRPLLCLFVSCVTRLKNSSLEKNLENLHWGIVWVTAVSRILLLWKFHWVEPVRVLLYWADLFWRRLKCLQHYCHRSLHHNLVLHFHYPIQLPAL